jgi:Cu+-exporting ATPase
LNALRLRFFKVQHSETCNKKISVAQVQIENFEIVQTKEETELKTELKIEGMMCQHCVKHVHNALEKMDGVTGVEVSLENKNAIVTSTKEISQSDFAKVIDDAGYQLVG